MPSYDFLCDKCGKTHAAFMKISERGVKNPLCCDVMTRQVILSPPMVDDYFIGSTKNEGYHCPVSERWVDSKKKRKDVISEFNVVPKE